MKQICRARIESLKLKETLWYPIIVLGYYGPYVFQKNYKSKSAAYLAAENFAKKYNISLKWTRR